MLFARLLVGGIESAKSDKSVWVRIAGKIGDREFSAAGAGSFKGSVSESNVNSVITRPLDAAVSEIELLLTPVQEPPSTSAAGSGG